MRPMQRKEREDCVNEVRILASSVNNPSIVRYFDAFMEEGDKDIEDADNTEHGFVGHE